MSETNKESICPRCNGTGHSRAFNRRPKFSEEVRNKAIELFDKKLPLREIAKKFKIKHTQTIKNILNYK